MNSKELKNNDDLLAYLVQLGAHLQTCNQSELAEIVNQASRFANGSSSEFMHEAEMALERVTKDLPKQLSDRQYQDIETVLLQIKETFRKVGGA